MSHKTNVRKKASSQVSWKCTHIDRAEAEAGAEAEVEAARDMCPHFTVRSGVSGGVIEPSSLGGGGNNAYIHTYVDLMEYCRATEKDGTEEGSSEGGGGGGSHKVLR